MDIHKEKATVIDVKLGYEETQQLREFYDQLTECNLDDLCEGISCNGIHCDDCIIPQWREALTSLTDEMEEVLQGSIIIRREKDKQ